jgi:hypothetical protein
LRLPIYWKFKFKGSPNFHLNKRPKGTWEPVTQGYAELGLVPFVDRPQPNVEGGLPVALSPELRSAISVEGLVHILVLLFNPTGSGSPIDLLRHFLARATQVGQAVTVNVKVARHHRTGTLTGAPAIQAALT